MFFKNVILDRLTLVDLDTLFTALFVPWSCICSFIDSDTTGIRDIMGVESGIHIFITRGFFNNKE